MTGKWLGITLGVLLLLGVASAWGDVQRLFQSEPESTVVSETPYGRATVKFSDATVQASVPLNQETQAKGLGGRTHLGDGEGMLWIYDQPSVYTFWMRGMVIPLDFIWIRNQTVVDITADVPPPDAADPRWPLYQPNQPVDAVLEVPAGYAARHNITVGAGLTIDTF